MPLPIANEFSVVSLMYRFSWRGGDTAVRLKRAEMLALPVENGRLFRIRGGECCDRIRCDSSL